jgi:hypothetical protein
MDSVLPRVLNFAMNRAFARAERESGETPALRPVTVSTPARRAPDDRPALAVLLGIPLGITAWGWRYYTLSPAGRLRHPLHALLKSSGPVGLALGVLGLAMFLFMWAYVLRKSVRALAWTGTVGSWLRVHIVIGLALPVIVAVHAGWRFDGLIGLGYFAMFVVALSGIVGRYLYTRIPRRQNGVEMSLEEVSQERRALLTRIAAATGLEPLAVERALALDPEPYARLDPVRTIIGLVRDDLQRARMMRRLRQQWERPRPGAPPPDRVALRDTLRLARREIALQQEVRVLEVTRRLFGAWHVFHRPFAATALIAVIVHVVVALVVGGVGFAGPRP